MTAECGYVKIEHKRMYPRDTTLIILLREEPTMTYEERIAASQAKMDAFKAKMTAIGEKTKAAHAMKKEEIAAAIDAINADLDDLDEAIAYEFSGGIKESIDDTLDEIDAAVDDSIKTVEGDVNAAKENARLAKERKESKANALKLEAQMKAEALKAKLAERRDSKDKAAMELYILDLLDYAECCQQLAFAAAIESDLALLEAAEVAADYVEKFGEPAEEAEAE